MSKSKKSIEEFDLFSASLGTTSRQTIISLLEQKEKLQQKNQQLLDESQEIHKKQDFVEESLPENQTYSKIIPKELFKFSPKVRHWFKLLSKFISFEIMIQAINIGSGVLIVRSLHKEEYAYFVLANAMQSTINTLADSGIGSALSAIGGRVWQDQYRFGQLIITAMHLRRYLALVAALVVMPILYLILVQNGASTSYTILLMLTVFIEIYFYLDMGVLIVVPRLQSDVEFIQRSSLISSGLRILLLIGWNLSSILNALTGAISSAIASGVQNLIFWSHAKENIDMKASVSHEDKVEILQIVKTIAPNTAFYCIQGQMTIWLISVFGNTQHIAEVGALGRLSVIFSLISSIMTNIILPSFSRCQSYEVLLLKYKQIIFGYLFLSLMILLIAINFPKQLLQILGESYSSLERELLFSMVAAITSAVTSMLWSVNASKGWTEQSWLFIPTIIITQIILLLSLDLSSVVGVSIFSTLSVIPASCINFYMTYKGLLKTRTLYSL